MTTPPPTSGSGAGPSDAARPPSDGAAAGTADGEAGTAEERSAPSGRAAELMAAVRAVESGERSATDFFAAPAPPPRTAPRAAPSAAPAAPHAAAPQEVPGEVHELLARAGAPAALAAPVVLALGPRAAEVLLEDPWQLLLVPGVRPEQADAFARALPGEEHGPDSPARGRALAVWLLARAARQGHTVLEVSALAQQLAAFSVSEAEAAVYAAAEEGLLLAFAPEQPPADGTRAGSAGSTEAGSAEADGEGGVAEPAGPVLVGLERWALAEESLAEGVQRLLTTFAPDTEGREEWEKAAASVSGPSARELIGAVAGAALVLHSGGESAKAEPAALAGAAAALGLRVCVAAWSEEDRERLGTAATDGSVREDACTAVTVAGLLGGSEGPGRDEEGCFTVDLLIVTDAGLLGTETAAALVESLPEGARLVLSGDPQLLGSAGAGQVLADLFAARICPQVVSRTPDPGPLGELVSSIGIGELPRVEAPDREVVIVPVRDAGEAVHRTVQLVADSVPRAVGVPAEQTQVVTVGPEGGAGARSLNAALKQRLNPGPGAFDGFDAGDRVLHTPQPGRSVPATVLGADESGLRLECFGQQITVPRELLAETVRHGWAITAHQAAGRRWPAAVVVLPGDAGALLDRRWVYTAFGRGARHVSVVQGLGPELDRIVAERPSTTRLTRLRSLLNAQRAEQQRAEQQPAEQ
ncbi:ATP-dependent RecD-like DNA helicase [Streptomyces sp. XM4193]|uniref:AAA family ATPase n=1 Tax=Streptomyces sp. XM4193 TaxID=2929782 RepID=UPI001FFAC547|nr:ATP-dependent RecD-like DNA helicase [Streptomyces sp. XM4193]MCK1797961.1 ATP-dependent RecD-like DNA helicase [Streptomyces sp. XM4193]